MIQMTDVEVIESRTPLLLKEYLVRRGSGGTGRFRGGDGCIRHFIALEPLNVSIVSQRRVFAPYGMEGGSPGARGLNLLYRRNDKTGVMDMINLGNNGMAAMKKGDEVRIETPGGGGWGASDEK